MTLEFNDFDLRFIRTIFNLMNDKHKSHFWLKHTNELPTNLLFSLAICYERTIILSICILSSLGFANSGCINCVIFGEVFFAQNISRDTKIAVLTTLLKSFCSKSGIFQSMSAKFHQVIKFFKRFPPRCSFGEVKRTLNKLSENVSLEIGFFGSSFEKT